MTDAPPIFVVGAPRTGTTLVKNVLNRHTQIHLFDEVHFFERIWEERRAIGDLSRPCAEREAIRRLARIVREFGSDKEMAEVLPTGEFRRRMVREGGGYRGLLAALLKMGAERAGAKFWGDSSPQDLLYLPTIFEWFPEARIVATVRDPRGFLSSYKNYWRRRVPTYRERYNPLTNSALWRSYMRALLDARQAPWGARLLTLRYEDLVSDPEARVRQLCEHVEVEYEPGMVDVDMANTSFTDGQEVSSPRGIFATSRERWRQELTPTEIWLGERVFGRIMREFGYRPEGAEARIRPSVAELLQIFALLPGRLFNMLFRSHKPFKLSRLRRVLSLFRSD